MKYTILTTDVEGFTYDEYLDWCDVNGVEEGDEESGEFYEWAAEEARINYESDIENIRDFAGYNVPVVICGTVELWNGHHEIVPIRTESVYDAIRKCFERCIDDINVVWEDGLITIYAYHHDGTNIFNVSALSKRGLAKKSADYKPYDMKKLPYLYY